MITIKNKLESDAFILSSGRNYTPFALVRTAREALHYLRRGKVSVREPFSIRFKGTGMQPFLPNLSAVKAYEFCVIHFREDNTPLGIYEATEGYDDYRSVNCEICINKDCTVDAHYCKGNMKMRDALKSSDSIHVVRVNLDFKPLRWAIDYLCKFHIIDHVVALTQFNKKMGVKKEYIVCWEVRNF